MEASAQKAKATRDVAFLLRPFPLLVLFSSATYLAFCVAALASQQLLYADGALFAFLALVRHPWVLFLSAHAPRAAAAFVMLAPASIGRRWFGLDLDATVLAYQVTALAFPPVMAALTAALLPRQARVNVMTVVLTLMVGLGLSAFAFPTEAMIGAAALCPALALLLFPRPGLAAWGLLTALLAIVAFSHEGQVLCFPVVLLAAWRGWRRGPAPARRWLVAAMGPFALMALAAPIIAMTPAHASPLLNGGATHGAGALAAEILVIGTNPMFCACLAVFLLWPLSLTTSSRALKALALVLTICVTALGVAAAPKAVFPEFNYHVRAYLLVLSPLFAGLVVLLAYAPLPILDRRGLCFFLCLVAVQAAHEATALTQWTAYKAALVHALDTPGPVAAPFSDALARTGRLAQAPDPEFAWAAPYQSLFLNGSRRRILLSTTDRFTPFACRDRSILHQDRPSEIAPIVYDALLDDICRKSPS